MCLPGWFVDGGDLGSFGWRFNSDVIRMMWSCLVFASLLCALVIGCLAIFVTLLW